MFRVGWPPAQAFLRSPGPIRTESTAIWLYFLDKNPGRSNWTGLFVVSAFSALNLICAGRPAMPGVVIRFGRPRVCSGEISQAEGRRVC